MTAKRPTEDRRRMIAVALGVQTEREAREFLDGGSEGADVVELRLDFFTEAVNVRHLVQSSPVPLIVTNRPPREGGRSPLSDAERLETLFEAAEAGAAFVDLEWDVATTATIQKLHAAGSRVIASRHDFDRMPPNLDQWARDLSATAADVIKVVGMARDAVDVKSVLEVFEASTKPAIAIAMGPAGQSSRILGLRYHSCLLTFAAPATIAGTAPGQISIADLRRVYRAAAVDSQTSVFGLLGAQVDLPTLAVLNEAIAATRINAVVVPFPTEGRVAIVVDRFRSLPVDGWIVSPAASRTDLIGVVDHFTDKASRIGLVSAIRRAGDELIGDHPNASPIELVGQWFHEAR